MTNTTLARLKPIVSPKLSGVRGIRHAFFTREGGVSGGIYRSLNAGLGSKDDPEHVMENRRRMADWFEVDLAALFTCYQVHSAKTVVAEAPWTTERPEADGVIAYLPKMICSVLSADCAPVLLADPTAGVVAAVHAGWKGALTGVIDFAVKGMVEDFGATPEGIIAAVGPCIGPQSYEVGLEFLDRFEAHDPGASRFFAAATDDKRLFDLPAYCLSRLARAGVVEAEWTGHDTCADAERFFSNRRAFKAGEGDYGRLLSAITLL
jgi:hypothetical protein